MDCRFRVHGRVRALRGRSVAAVTTLAWSLALVALTLAAPPLGAQLTDLGNQLIDECTASLETCEAGDRFGTAVAVGDFNNDGFMDLAVSVAGETVSSQANAGAVHVFYGSPGGLKLTGDQVFTQATTGIAGTPEANDRWGNVLAAGRLDIKDAFDDLAIGAPLEDLVVGATNHVDAGSVEVLFGSAGGLSAANSPYFDQNSLPFAGESIEAGDRFGNALAVGVPGQLLIGAPGEDGVFSDEGLVVDLEALTVDLPLSQGFHIRQSAFLGNCGELGELNDRFGAALTPGGAISAPGETVDFVAEAGWVVDGVFGIEDCWHQNTVNVADSNEAFDRFGEALAEGDFDGNGELDLAIGVPGEDNDTLTNTGLGAVQVLYNSAFTEVFDQADFDGGWLREASDEFGSVLAAGDFDGDGISDLAIGVPGEGISVPGGTREDAGLVHVLYGTPVHGLTATGNQTFHQDFPAGMLGGTATSDVFGAALAAGDFDGNGVDDLAVGVPGDNPSGINDAGRVQVIYGLDRATGAFGTAYFSHDGAVTFPEEQGARLLFVFRDGGAVLPASVDRVRVGGTATPGTDFSYTDGSESWTAGEVGFEIFSITINGDSVPEPNETVVLELRNPSTGLALGTPSTLTITIEDNDGGNCFPLTRAHTGNGADPIATPFQSVGCPAGRYVPNALVSLLASPDPGWIVVGWTGTNNDAAKTLANTVTMPAAPKQVSVTYFPFDLVLADTTLPSGVQTVEACNSITTSGKVVVGATTTATFRAGSTVSLSNGFSVAGSFTAVLAKPGVCP